MTIEMNAHLQQYRAALRSGDYDAVDELLDSLDPVDRRSLLVAIDAETPEDAPQQTLAEARAGFEGRGVEPGDAAFLATLTHASLGEFVGEGLDREQLTLDQLVDRVVTDLNLGGATDARARVRVAVENLVAGRNMQDRRLAQRALDAIGAALGASGDALARMVDRTYVVHGGAIAEPGAARAAGDNAVTLNPDAVAEDDDEVDLLFFRDIA